MQCECDVADVAPVMLTTTTIDHARSLGYLSAAVECALHTAVHSAEDPPVARWPAAIEREQTLWPQDIAVRPPARARAREAQEKALSRELKKRQCGGKEDNFCHWWWNRIPFSRNSLPGACP